LKDVVPGTKTHNEWTIQLNEYSNGQLKETMSGPDGLMLADDATPAVFQSTPDAITNLAIPLAKSCPGTTCTIEW
jgi:hypothetical protein